MILKSMTAILLVVLINHLFSQTTDSAHINYLPEIQIVGKQSINEYQQMPEIVGTTIYAGKKNSLIQVDHVMGNKSTNTMRQVLAKVPGIHIWESDGSGIQIGISTRGLSPNRSWEFNIRQNGYDIAADPFGYPEAYYNPQLQAVQKIEIVRGQASLQYGPQIGGLVNYLMKDGSQLARAIQVEGEQTVGSNGLINTFNALGGKTKRFHYYTFYDHRSADGYRKNSQYHTNTFFGTFTYHLTARTTLTMEGTRWSMLSQQPGGLTDSELFINPKQSYRARNWMQLDWTIGALSVQHRWNEKNKLLIKGFVMDAKRNSIGFNPTGGITVKDTLNNKLDAYNPRTIDVDAYLNMGIESKWLSEFKALGRKQILSAGLRLYSGHTDRWRGGKESGVSETYTLEREAGSLWNAEIAFATTNVAFFTEQVWQFSKNLLIIPGIRIEYLAGQAKGFSGIKDNTLIPLVPRSKSRTFILPGLAAEYHLGNLEVYANINKSYRPIQFADLTTPPTSDEFDSNIKDSKAINMDLGVRGIPMNGLRVDAGIYYLHYQNRIGTIRQQRTDASFYNLRTNVGHSIAYGLESLIEWNISKTYIHSPTHEVIPYVSYACNQATYDRLLVITQSNNKLVEQIINGHVVENAPRHIIRSGMEWRHRALRLQLSHAYTSSMYTDANNTETPTTNAQNGKIPSYHIWDVSSQLKINKNMQLRLGVNNLMNTYYFTRRAGGYPGPGALPADGRTMWMAFGYKL